MILREAREGVVHACQEMQRLGLVVGTAGNVSVRVDDLVAISPSGVEYADLTLDQVGVHDLAGEPVDAPLKPSSELPLHLAVYAGTGAGAITHNHAPASTAMGLLILCGFLGSLGSGESFRCGGRRRRGGGWLAAYLDAGGGHGGHPPPASPTPGLLALPSSIR